MSESEEKTYARLRTITEAAEWLGRKPRTLRDWIQRGLIESHKLFGCRMISEEEIIRLIEESRIPARNETRPRVNSVTTSTRGRGSR
jgi:excisionase family DNA binding protein